jgi:YbbR domain-containing protein
MKRQFRKSIKPIIGSIFLSIMLWFMVTTSKEYTTKMKVPLEVSRLAKGKTLLEPIPSEVTLEIQGSGQSLIALYLYEASFRLELPQVTKNTKIILADQLVFLDLPSRLGLEVVEILEPKTLDLKVDDFIVAEKPAQFSGKISTEPGYIVLDTSYSRDSIRITGPKTLIDEIINISTEPRNFENRKYAFNTIMKLESPVPNLVKLFPQEIDVQFEIQRIVERVVYDIPVTIINVPNDLLVESSPISLSLRIKGGEKNVEKLSPDEISAEIDFALQYNPEQSDYPVRIKTPSEISWLESSPKTFKLTVKRK